MKRALLAATLLSSAVALSVPAFAIDVTVETGGQAEVVVGKPANLNPAADDAANQFAAITTPAAVINPEATAVGQVQIRTDGGEPPFAILGAEELNGVAVTTNDGTAVGTVTGAATTTDGETVFLVEATGDVGVATLAVRLSSLIQTAAGLVIDTTGADLSASIAAALAGEPMPAPPEGAAPAAPAAPAPDAPAPAPGAAPAPAPAPAPEPAPAPAPAAPPAPAPAPAPAAPPAPAPGAPPAPPAG
ncbi:MAG: hypothetical protein AB7O56_08965 [Bauldia sp.]